LIAACLAPTDAGLGAVIVNDPSLPRRVRRTLNVESGLNDGIASPVVTLAIALTLREELGASDVVADAAWELGIGLVTGLVVALAGGRALVHSRRRGWVAADLTPVAVLVLAVLAYTGALAVDGNGFISAFVAGLAFAPSARALGDIRSAEAAASADAGGGAGEEEGLPLELAELGGQLLGGVVWFFFGAVLIQPVVDQIDATTLLYALLSLTVVRMVPIALSLAGTGLAWPTVAFFGWFGPRGLASLVFGLEAVDELDGVAGEAIPVIGVSVLISVVVHGGSAGPLARRYSRWAATREPRRPTEPEEPHFRARRRMALGSNTVRE
jgi:NhaP-type Na+/H+ or K+/H+ antiporter